MPKSPRTIVSDVIVMLGADYTPDRHAPIELRYKFKQFCNSNIFQELSFSRE